VYRLRYPQLSQLPQIKRHTTNNQIKIKSKTVINTRKFKLSAKLNITQSLRIGVLNFFHFIAIEKEIIFHHLSI
jgi:hypothetical protein